MALKAIIKVSFQVPYVIDGGLHPEMAYLFTTAAKVFEDKTCIRFVPRTNERDYVLVKDGGRCLSEVGYLEKGAQIIILGKSERFDECSKLGE